MKTASRSALLAALAALLALPLTADDPPACPAIDPPALLRQGLGGQAAPLLGLRAFRDPVTGELRKPTPEEAAAAAKVEAEATPELQRLFEVVIHPDGMKTLDLRGAFASAAVAVRNPDGSITIRCMPPGAPPTPPPDRSKLEEK